MAKQVLKVGIISREEYRKRTIAKGEYVPRQGEPKVWCESLKAVSQLLSGENQELSRLILEKDAQGHLR